MSDISRELGPLPGQFQIRETRVTVTNSPASGLLVGGNALRWGLIFCPPFDSIAGSFANGFVALSPSVPGGTRWGHPVNLQQGFEQWFRRHGSAVQLPWYGFILGGSTQVDWYIIEVIIQQ